MYLKSVTFGETTYIPNADATAGYSSSMTSTPDSITCPKDVEDDKDNSAAQPRFEENHALVTSFVLRHGTSDLASSTKQLACGVSRGITGRWEIGPCEGDILKCRIEILDEVKGSNTAEQVLYMVHRFLQQQISPKDIAESDKKFVLPARSQRSEWMTRMGSLHAEPIRRIDFLQGKTMLRGLRPSTLKPGWWTVLLAPAGWFTPS